MAFGPPVIMNKSQLEQDNNDITVFLYVALVTESDLTWSSKQYIEIDTALACNINKREEKYIRESLVIYGNIEQRGKIRVSQSHMDKAMAFAKFVAGQSGGLRINIKTTAYVEVDAADKLMAKEHQTIMDKLKGNSDD